LAATGPASALSTAGHAQLIFADGMSTSPQDRFDLDFLASTPTAAAWVIADAVPPDTRTCRRVAQALLLAGVPSLIVGTANDSLQLVDAVLERGANERVAKLFAEVERAGALPGLRVFGHRGLTASERVDFALGEVTRLAREGSPLFKQARERQERRYWLDARAPFSELADTFAYLRRPENVALVEASSHDLAKGLRAGAKKTGKSIARMLQDSEANNRKNLAAIYVSLGEVDDAAALQEVVLAAAQADGDGKAIAAARFDLGATLYRGKRYADAALQLRGCADSAQQVGDPKLKAACLSQLGSTLRELFDTDGAIRAYHEEGAVFAKLRSESEANAFHDFLSVLVEVADHRRRHAVGP